MHCSGNSWRWKRNELMKKYIKGSKWKEKEKCGEK